jgi:hypothetical protein
MSWRSLTIKCVPWAACDAIAAPLNSICNITINPFNNARNMHSPSQSHDRQVRDVMRCAVAAAEVNDIQVTPPPPPPLRADLGS